MGFLSEIYLENFRNYTSQKLTFQSGLNIFVGENGHGKSNMLEAVYFLSLLRSFRCKNIQNLKNWKSDSFSLKGTLKLEDSLPDKLLITYGDKRVLKVNDSSVSRGTEFIRKINTVSFTPEDIELIKGSAGNRRQFLDITLSQLSPSYLRHLQTYNKALKARNTLLRNYEDGKALDQSLFNTYEKMMVEAGVIITKERINLLKNFEEKIRHFTELMFPEGKKLKIIYQSSISKSSNADSFTEELFQQKLDESYSKDLQRGMTQIGPHRDDLFILLQGKSLSSFGSEGQCRLASLVIKMTAAEQLIENEMTGNVVLLIDDVLGELDETRKNAFLKTIMRGDQIFIACTEIPEFCKSAEHSIFHVENGRITQETSE
ncbi:MAG: DNA replication/repair protein RecF [Lentisphaeraceae bacterium]|nr:DNA replication/repair protein RecF [Lentisphaeraceae bacterium]